MPWEERSGRRYFYRKVRRGGRVFSVYEGGGFAGQLAAERQAVQAAERTQSREELRREATKQDRLDALVGKSEQAAAEAERALLAAAGYHSHKRQWRLKRVTSKTG